MVAAGWGTLLITMIFASVLVALAIIISERFAGVWAPFWIVCFLIGMSIVFDYGGVRQTELHLFGTSMFFACGPLLWPVLALGQDYINEFYGKDIAMNYTYGMFLAKIGVALATLWIIFYLPIPVTDPQRANIAKQFNSLMMLSPRLNIASIIAVVAAFLTNAKLYALIKSRTKGKRLWLRQIVASCAALTIDGFVFYYVGFAFVLPWAMVWNMTISYIFVCYLTVFIDMFFLYAMVGVKKNNLFGISDRIGESLNIQTQKAYQNKTEERN